MDCTDAASRSVLFADYDRRFSAALSRLPDRRPWQEADRAEIRAAACRCLGIQDGWCPTITIRHRRRTCQDGFVIQHLRATSWPGVHTCAHLYLPAHAGMDAMPAVLLCCGHGKGGKHCPGYQAMAAHLVRLGMAVLVPDNIGQGEREWMGHGDAVSPFACGTSLQGLIVLEAMAWLDWLERDSRFDSARVAAIGNSGGGTLTVFLGALRDELAAVASTGYPSTFEFIARKEKRHCLCNVIPGIVAELEMWHLLGCVAPRPLLIAQGAQDVLFPSDLFHRVARQIEEAYAARGCRESFRAHLVPGEHSWDPGRCELIGGFLAAALGVPRRTVFGPEPAMVAAEDTCFPCRPDGALDVKQLCQQLTGKQPPEGRELWDVFPIPSTAHRLPAEMARGDLRRILAQFEAFLSHPTQGVTDE